MTMLHSRIFAYAVLIWLISAVHALSATAPTRVVVGYAAMNGRVAPLWIADEQGFLARNGLQADQVYIRGAPLLVAGMASGDIQFGRSGGSATLAAVGAGHDFKIVATFSSRNSYDLIARPNIKRPEDLRGKKSRSTASAAPAGWVCSFGSNIWASIKPAIRSACRCSAINRS
jgi:ABC-type nitrate/sulfonate/bicarbonate transport system substrate-binding protein